MHCIKLLQKFFLTLSSEIFPTEMLLHSIFNKYLLWTLYGPGNVLSAQYTSMNKTGVVPALTKLKP